jgi:hypothetical protein
LIASTFVSCPSSVISDRACWPLMSTSGVPAICELTSAPIAWPTPAAAWRLTSTGAPVDCA